MLLWLDLETTGLDPATGRVLEVGAILTTDDLEEQRRLNIVVEFMGEVDNGVIREMHEENGLLLACQYSSVTEQEAGWMLHDWLEEYMNSRDTGERLTLAGSGVAHFDLPWLKAKWPHVVEKLTYWVIDVGIMRRGNRLVGFDMPEVDKSSSAKTHRALEDVEAHLMEMRATKEVHRNA